MENMMTLVIDKLVDELNKATVEYDKGTPIMSDLDWDKKYFNLQFLEKRMNYVREDSPTQKVYFETVSELKKKEHLYPMLSLNKATTINELLNFIGDKNVLLSLKMDGLSCALTYENGILVGAETRGDGIIGEDILHNVKCISNVPNKIPVGGRIVVHGEIISTYKNLENFPEYNNPRNFAAGSIRLLNSEESAKRNLKFIMWDVLEQPLPACKTKQEEFILMKQLFDTVPNERFCPKFTKAYTPKLEEVLEQLIDKLKQEAKELSYPIDGIVFRYENNKYAESLGNTAHHPRHSLAYKFLDEEFETELINIEWSSSRNNRLTPVAIFNPIKIDGTIVSKASLHNLTILEEILDQPYVGQKIWIKKAKQIIPQVVRSEVKLNPKNLIEIPHVCPICGGATDKLFTDTCEHLVCTNENCQGAFIESLENFVGKKGLDIKGLSKKTMEKLHSFGWLNKKIDIFFLENHKDEWIKKPGFGQLSVTKVLDSVNNSKSLTLDKFLASLGIPLIGGNVAKEVAVLFNNYEDFRDAIDNKYSFSSVNNFGYEKENSLLSFDYSEADEIAKILNIKPIAAKSVENSDIKNKIFVITGKLNNGSRDQLKKIIEDNGGKVTNSVSSKTNYLICNDKDSTTGKAVKARTLGIPIVTELDFYEMIK